MKRFFTMLGLAAALILMILPTAAILQAEPPAKPMQSHDFTDVPVTGQEFMEPYINEFYHKGITGGCSASPLQYCPTNAVTRGSMAVFMGRALGYVDMVTDNYNARAYFKQTDPALTSYGVVATSINGPGVWGLSETYIGVRGHSTDNNGVSGGSINGYGVYANSTEDSALYAQSNVSSTDANSDTIYDLVLGGGAGEIFSSGTFNLESNGSFLVLMDQNDNNASFFVIRNSDSVNVFTVDESGSMTATGTKSAIVDTVSHGQRKLYAVEATENWFEDFGTGELVDGEAVIEIDPIFAETVNLSEDYHVFFTPVDGSAVLYVTEMSGTSFTVRSEGGEDVQFSYRIVAKRLGYEEVRMEEVETD